MLKIFIKILFFLGLMLGSFLSQAQSNFYKGYIVTNAGDTLKGYVEGRESNVNPITVKYKSDLNGVVEQFAIADCKAFKVDGKEKYERYVVKLTLGKNSVAEAPIGKDTTSTQRNVFLRVLNEGANVSLYDYSDEIKTRFYIKESNAAPVELELNVFYLPESNAQLKTESKYLNQLYALFKKYDIPESEDKKLSDAKYRDEDLIKIASIINRQNYVKPRYSSFSFFAGVGAGLNFAKYTGQTIYAEGNASQKSAIMPMFSAGVNFFYNPAYRKSLVRVDFSFYSTNNSFIGEEMRDNFSVRPYVVTHILKQNIFALRLQFIQNLYNTDNFKFFIGAGVAGNYTLIGKNTQHFQYKKTTFYAASERFEAGPEVLKTNISIPTTLGVVFQNVVELSVGYTLKRTIIDYTSFSAKQQNIVFGVNYLFNRSAAK